MSNAAKVRIRLDEAGRGSVTLNDLDLSAVTTAIEFAGKVGDLTQVKLTIWADIDVDLTAKIEQIIVRNAEPARSDDGVTLLDGRVLKVRKRTW